MASPNASGAHCDPRRRGDKESDRIVLHVSTRARAALANSAASYSASRSRASRSDFRSSAQSDHPRLYSYRFEKCRTEGRQIFVIILRLQFRDAGLRLLGTGLVRTEFLVASGVPFEPKFRV